MDGLRALLGKIVPANPFYSERLRHADISAGLSSLGEYVDRTPFTHKADLVEDQSLHPPFGTNLTYPLDHYTRYNQTSGTGGQPIRWLDTNDSWSWMVDNWAEVFAVSGVGRGDRIFFAFSFGPFLGFWTAFEAGVRIDCLCIPGGGMSTSARLRAILENECTVLCCTPTYAMRLGEAAIEEGIDLGKSAVRRIMAAGEPGASIPGTRDRIEQLWPGAKIIDHHGMTEVGPVTFECPVRRGVLHVIERAFIPEVIDPASTQPISPGAEGELVLTNLGRDGSPLLRYRTGDLVRLDDHPADRPCACGRFDMALVGGILGRTDDMVVVRGVNVHPSAVEAVIRRFDEVAEFRVRQFSDRALVELEIEIEPISSCRDVQRLASEVEGALRTAFNLRIPACAVAPGSLPRFEMKAKRWVKEERSEREATHA